MTPTMKLWIAIVGIALTGIVTRCSFLIFGERVRLGPGVERALRHAPAAALAASLAPALLLDGGRLDIGFDNHRLIAGIVSALVVWRTKGILWGMASGLAAFTLLRLYA